MNEATQPSDLSAIGEVAKDSRPAVDSPVVRKRIGDIECLRAIAVIAVIVLHANSNLLENLPPAAALFFTYFGGGFGVDLFFAISGFVIARQLIPQLQACPDRSAAIPVLIQFWMRRMWRLWPTAWLWLGVILVSVVFFNETGAFGTARANIEATVAGILQVANFRFAENFGIREIGASFPYWSLSLEEQFYLLLPIVVLVVRKHLPLLLVLVIALQFFCERGAYMMAFRTDALAFGVLLALWVASDSYKKLKPVFLYRRWWCIGVVATLLCCLALLGTNNIKIVPIRMGLIALVSAVLVWIASYDMDVLAGRGILRKIWLWVGSRSYALYIIHIPAFFLTREFFHRFYPEFFSTGGSQHGWLILGAAFFLIVFSELNFRLVENPLRAYGSKVARSLRNAWD